MKLMTIALATALALTSTLALAQSPGLAGYGSTVAPSVGSYVYPSVGSYLNPPTWRTTGPAAPMPGPVNNAFARPLAPMHLPSRSTVAPRVRGHRR